MFVKQNNKQSAGFQADPIKNVRGKNDLKEINRKK